MFDSMQVESGNVQRRQEIRERTCHRGKNLEPEVTEGGGERET